MDRETFFQFAAALAQKRMQRGKLSPEEYAQNLWRLEDRPWVRTRKQAAVARMADSTSEPIFQAFACEICKQSGHFCPATKLGYEDTKKPEHWCAACKAGFRCVPGMGERDMGGKSKARKLRTQPCAI